MFYEKVYLFHCIVTFHRCQNLSRYSYRNSSFRGLCVSVYMSLYRDNHTPPALHVTFIRRRIEEEEILESTATTI